METRGINRNILVTVVLFQISACSSMQMDYVTKDELQYDPAFINSKSEFVPSGKYGAIKLRKDGEPDEKARLFMLNKSNGTYSAETMVKNSKKKKYFFSFGLDVKNTAPKVGFRLEF